MMGEQVTLRASDGHDLAAYLAQPQGPPRGGLVVCQEIFGVNAHIRRVTDGFAAEGYLAIAPALFDRMERGVELDYNEASMARARALGTALAWDTALSDVSAAVDAVRTGAGVAAIGYCRGGSVAWLAACRLDLQAAVGYYGGQIHEFLGEMPGCPVMLHFGEHDPIIPAEDVAEIAAAHPELPVFTYPVGHGFNCDARADFDQAAADLARKRTLAFLEQHLG
jgi:carboxymethylenebutenolidase